MSWGMIGEFPKRFPGKSEAKSLEKFVQKLLQKFLKKFSDKLSNENAWKIFGDSPRVICEEILEPISVEILEIIFEKKI